MIGDTRQGWALLAAMTLVFIPLLVAVYIGEGVGNPVLAGLGADQVATATNPGGNMEGKEVRFGVANSGAVGRRHDLGVERLGQFDARFVHAALRHGADVADAARRSDLRRRGLRDCTG